MCIYIYTYIYIYLYSYIYIVCLFTYLAECLRGAVGEAGARQPLEDLGLLDTIVIYVN